MEEKCKKVAMDALNAIIGIAGKNVYFSWGVSKVGCTFYNKMPTLILKVNGLLHTGNVLVSLNEGADLYEVRLMKREKVIKTITDVYYDQLGYVIDANVERDTSLSEDEYFKRAMADSEIKCNAK